ncbi:uncharacterized protein LOC114784793 isoform X2 [Denticeps clupeoides]|uniref:uncharacterized protein LOC114784793 isoform X2 n=1 Tax=Denticeps clupeoides TaxID=299321 RepID=UPI0010A56313|nr:uncharacterized protein LOC114784793 isoform X2 [Denticeps clupeoides]
MAARAHAAASLSPDQTAFSCFSSCKSQCFCTSSSRLSALKRSYSRTFLLDVGRNKVFKLNSVDTEELNGLGLLRRPTQSPTPTPAPRPQWRRLKRCERKQKRGKRGGVRARLAASPHKPAIPSIVLANVRSLENKLDYIRLLRSSQRNVKDCCVFVFTETWLSDSVPDRAIQLDQLTCYRADRVVVTGDDYKIEARLKLPEAVEHTDLGTDGEDSPIKPKRRRIPKNILFPGEDEDEKTRVLPKPKPWKKLAELPSAPKSLHSFGPNPEGNDTREKAVLTGKPQVHYNPELNQRDHTSPNPSQLDHASSSVSQRDLASPSLSQRPQTSLHTWTENCGLEPNLLPLADCQSVDNLEERLRNSPDLKNQLINTLALKRWGRRKRVCWKSHGCNLNSQSCQ